MFTGNSIIDELHNGRQSDNVDIDDLVNKINEKRSQKIKVSRRKTENITNDLPSNKIDLDKDDLDELDATTRRALKDLTHAPDYYKILGLTLTATDEQIKVVGKKKILQYHPDKVKHLIESSQNPAQTQKKYEMLYKLSHEAYNVLRNPTSRKGYDLQRKTVHNKDFLQQKNAFENFIKLQDSEITEQSRENANLKFLMASEEMNRKHGFNAHEVKQPGLTMDETNAILASREAERIKDDELWKDKHEDRFKNKSFSLKEFNSNWEKMKKREERRHGKDDSNNGSMVLWGGISAANDMGLDGASDYVPYDSNYDNLYSTNPNSSMFASKLDDSLSGDEISIGEYMSDDDNINVDYVDNHNADRDPDELVRRMKEFKSKRKGDMRDQKNRKATDRTYWKGVMENPFNVSSQMGNVVGNDLKTLGYVQPRRNTVDMDRVEAYKQLVFGDEEDEKPKKSSSKVTKVKRNKKNII
jgi:curved DNA-binding protein CbpA